MDDAGGMGGGQGGGDVSGDRDGLRGLERWTSGQAVRQRTTGDVVEDDRRFVPGDLQGANVDDVRFVEGPKRLELALQTGSAGFVGDDDRVEALDRDLLARLRVERPPDLRRSAATGWLEKLVPAEQHGLRHRFMVTAAKTVAHQDDGPVRKRSATIAAPLASAGGPPPPVPAARRPEPPPRRGRAAPLEGASPPHAPPLRPRGPRPNRRQR